MFSSSRTPPPPWGDDTTDCTQIFANAKQLANFNRQFLVDLRKAYGGPRTLALEEGLVSPVFRDSGDWGGRRLLGADDQQHYVASTALSTYGRIAADNKLDDDPFKAPTAADADKGPRQMLEVFLKSAPFLKVAFAWRACHFCGRGGAVEGSACCYVFFCSLADNPVAV